MINMAGQCFPIRKHCFISRTTCRQPVQLGSLLVSQRIDLMLVKLVLEQHVPPESIHGGEPSLAQLAGRLSHVFLAVFIQSSALRKAGTANPAWKADR